MKLKKIILFIIGTSVFLYGECSDLSYSDCIYWSEYCEWSNDLNQCQEIGGGGDGGTDFGPFEYLSIDESQGLRNGPDYRDGVLYYPVANDLIYKSIVITPGFGSNSLSMSSWGQFFASYGFTALIIGPNDEINDSHQQRAEGLIDGIETIKYENERADSPLYGLIDTESFSVCGYSMGGGASQIAATLDNSIKSAIALNPTIIIEDCSVCTDNEYCICLVPEFLDHPVPTIIFAGEIEINELPDYDGILGQDCYVNMPESTDKILFEVSGEGHGAAAYPYGEIAQYIIDWVNYQVLNNDLSCPNLLETPLTASEYQTNIECSESIYGDVNGDSLVNVQDIILTVSLILSETYNYNSDLNLDGSIDVLDVVIIINIIV